MTAFIIHNMAPIMFASLVVFLLLGYPVAFALAADGLIFGLLGIELGLFRPDFLQALPERVYGIMSNDVLLAIPFFTFMGLILERSGMAEDLLDTIGQLFGTVRGGLAYAVVFVGALLAATTGVVAASVISMGLISLPIMLRYGYDRRLATGVIAASGTLAQIIPPSLVLIVMADQLGTLGRRHVRGRVRPRPRAGRAVCRLRLPRGDALSETRPRSAAGSASSYQASRWRTLALGSCCSSCRRCRLCAARCRGRSRSLHVGTHLLDVTRAARDLRRADRMSTRQSGGQRFAIATAPTCRRTFYAGRRLIVRSRAITDRRPQSFVMVPPLALIFLVLGTIFIGVATPTEGGAMGAAGALILAHR